MYEDWAIEWAKKRTVWANELLGDLDKEDGIDCKLCKNKGKIFKCDDEGNEWAEDCECMALRRAVRSAKSSGMAELLEEYTFDNYQHAEKWQDDIYRKAQAFVGDSNAPLWFIGGQVASGKTFICTAIVNELIKQGREVRYFVWDDIATILKQTVAEDKERYAELLYRLQNVEVLFIDDFFRLAPTKADIDKAFQIIYYRYNASKKKGERKITVLSSERMLNDIIQIDESIGSRIYEMAANGEYTINIAKDQSKNMRMNAPKSREKTDDDDMAAMRKEWGMPV